MDRPVKRRFPFLFALPVLPVLRLVLSLYYQRRRQPLRLLRVSNLLDSACDGRQIDKSAISGDVFGDVENVRTDTSTITPMQRYVGRYLAADNPTNASRQQHTYMRTDLRSEPGNCREISWKQYYIETM